MLTKLLRLARPHFLLAGLDLYVLGAASVVAHGAPFVLWPAVLGYLTILLAQASLSFSNDYFDIEADQFASPTLFSGGSGVLVRYPELKRPALWIAFSLTLASVILGVATWVVYRYPIEYLAFVGLGNLLAWFYAAPPLRLAYHGLGELATALTSGVLLPGMGILTARGSLAREGLLLALPLILYGLCFILLVEIPDIEADRRAGKRTLAARAGREVTFRAVAGLCLGASAYFFVRSGASTSPFDFGVLGALSLLPLAVSAINLVARPFEPGRAVKAVNALVITLAAFFTLTDAYLVYLAAAP